MRSWTKQAVDGKSMSGVTVQTMIASMSVPLRFRCSRSDRAASLAMSEVAVFSSAMYRLLMPVRVRIPLVGRSDHFFQVGVGQRPGRNVAAQASDFRLPNFASFRHRPSRPCLGYLRLPLGYPAPGYLSLRRRGKTSIIQRIQAALPVFRGRCSSGPACVSDCGPLIRHRLDCRLFQNLRARAALPPVLGPFLQIRWVRVREGSCPKPPCS